MNFRLVQKVKIVEEDSAIGKMSDLLKEGGYTNAFIVCDPFVMKMEIFGSMLKSLENSGKKYTVYDNVAPDPNSDIIDEGAGKCREAGCDCVIAVGGGSAMDVGRGVNILRWNGGAILEYTDPGKVMKHSPGLICVPTTAGTGSELSNGLIVTDLKTGVKVPILAVQGMSEYAVLDAAITKGLPPRLTAITGLDVFSHACESYMSILSCPLTDIVCEKIMADVIRFLPLAVNDGANMEARSRMLALASMGGWMLACASAHIGHSFAHVLGARHHLPHGLACSWTLPSMFELLAESQTTKIRAVGMILGASFDSAASAADIALETGSAYRKFCRSIGVEPPNMSMPDKLELSVIAEDITHEPLASLCPVPLDAEVIMSHLAGLYDIDIHVKI